MLTQHLTHLYQRELTNVKEEIASINLKMPFGLHRMELITAQGI